MRNAAQATDSWRFRGINSKAIRDMVSFTLSGAGVQYANGVVVAATTAFGGASTVSTAVNCAIVYK